MKTVNISPNQLRMARALLKLSTVQVSKAVGLTRPAYYAIENGNSDPKLSSFKAIVNFFESKDIVFLEDDQIRLGSK